MCAASARTHCVFGATKASQAMKISRLARALPVCAAISLLGCSDSIGPQLAIDASSVPFIAILHGPFIQVSIHNVSDRSVQLAACGGDILPMREQVVGGEWISAPLAACTGNFTPVSLDPGQTILAGAWNFDGASGTYRIRAPLYHDSITARPSRDASRRFTIR